MVNATVSEGEKYETTASTVVPAGAFVGFRESAGPCSPLKEALAFKRLVRPTA